MSLYPPKSPKHQPSTSTLAGGSSGEPPVAKSTEPLMAKADEHGGFLVSSDHQAVTMRDDVISEPLTFIDIGFTTTINARIAKAAGDKSLPGTPKVLLKGVTGQVMPGQMLAVMGPSGAGKSTFLDVLACRRGKGSSGQVFLGRHSITSVTQMASVASYVEQEDDLLGVLTVRETILYAARLSNPNERAQLQAARVDNIINVMGLSKCANTIIGNPIQKGISGGQKRRVTIAQSLVANPRVLFLDEPTSGLDTTTAREVITAIKRIAAQNSMIVIATIHQPNFETLALFESLLVLSEGQVMYNGAVSEMATYFDQFGKPVPTFSNPADHAIDLVNNDFELIQNDGHANSVALGAFAARILEPKNAQIKNDFASNTSPLPQNRALHASYFFTHTWILSERICINYARNLIAYIVRVAMYIAMGIMMATIWIRLGTDSATINDRLSVHFFSVAFLSFMSVAGIPAFIEERSVFVRERHNGLYKTGPFVLANSLVSIPFLLLCSFGFVVIAYYAIGLNPDSKVFGQFIAYLFLAIYAAESQMILVASLLPIFVAALAIASFMNGFWMCVQGYFIRTINLPPFWRYSFHYIGYQTYAFELLANADLSTVTFGCSPAPNTNGTCACAYPSTQQQQCLLPGSEVLTYLDINNISYAKWIIILISISLVFRVCWYMVLLRTK